MIVRRVGLLFASEEFKKRKIKSIRLSTKIAFEETIKETKAVMKNKAKTSFNIKKKTFLNTFTGKLYSKNTEKLPAAIFYNRAKFMEVYIKGETVNKKAIIPFVPENSKMRGVKFKLTYQTLFAFNQCFFKKVGKNLLLFANVNKDTNKLIAPFKKHYRNYTGQTKIKNGTAIPIGLVVDKVKYKKKYDIKKIVNSYAPDQLKKNIDKHMDLNRF